MLTSILRPLVDDLLSAPHPPVGIVLTGSHARGDAGRWSDVDVMVFVQARPATIPAHRLFRHRDLLINVTITTLADKRDEMSRPNTAMWIVPALRQARILADNGAGTVEELCREAREFSWEPLGRAGDSFASAELAGLAEEVFKVRAALETGNQDLLPYPAAGLILGLTAAVAVHRRLLIETENTYYRQVRAAVGGASAWSHLHRLATGLLNGPPGTLPAATAAAASLGLYVHSVDMLTPVLSPGHLEVVELALKAAREAPTEGLLPGPD